MAAPTIQLQPIASSGLDAVARVLTLLQTADATLRRQFLQAIGNAQGLRTLEELAELFEAGRITEALILADAIGPTFASAVEQVFTATGMDGARSLTQRTGIPIDFTTLNDRAQRVMRNSRQRLITNLTLDQRAASLATIQNGLARGLHPQQLAGELKASLGLTPLQQQQVEGYRRLLEQGSTRALQRELRDRRFDGTVRRAVRTGRPLTQHQINRMVDRYREKLVQYRAGVVAQTEALGAVNEAEDEMWQQAVESGAIDPATVKNIWHISPVVENRDSHLAMNGQVRAFGESFVSGDGFFLRFPGDPAAPASEVVNCHCVVARTIVS